VGDKKIPFILFFMFCWSLGFYYCLLFIVYYFRIGFGLVWWTDDFDVIFFFF
jgi:hypothetical protein